VGDYFNEGRRIYAVCGALETEARRAEAYALRPTSDIANGRYRSPRENIEMKEKARRLNMPIHAKLLCPLNIA
jgi:hypothetical protein